MCIRDSHALSVSAKGGLTVTQTSEAGTKVGTSDPMVACGCAMAHRLKGTPGITGLYPPRVHIDGGVWHLDVGSSHPGGWSRSQGLGCSPIKEERELGSERRETVRSLSVAHARVLKKVVPSTRGPG